MRQTNEKSVFLQALDFESPGQREEFLKEACAHDEPLRRSVEVLLRSHEASGKFLEQPHLESQPASANTNTEAADTQDDEAPPSLDFLSGSERPDSLGRLGPYEVLEVLGHGAMGVVLKAHDTKLARIVAVKVLAPEYSASATAGKRFLREARSAAAVTHPHVVTVYDVGKHDKTPYLVMECVAGQTLQERIERHGPLEVEEVVRIGGQAAQGLAAAHANSLVHRDVKPGNILLESGSEQVKITDFGLARAVDDPGLTKTGEVAGTPQFMSPEQAQGKTVDSRSDLFSLGSCLYAMCTGDSPFRADSTIVVIRRVCDESPQPIRELNADVPDWLAQIIDRLLEKDPDRRFQTAQEVVDLLEQHLAVLKSPAGAAKLATSKPTGTQRRRRAPVVAATAVLLAIGLGLTATESTGVTKLTSTVARIFGSADSPASSDDLADVNTGASPASSASVGTRGAVPDSNDSGTLASDAVWHESETAIVWAQPVRLGSPVNEGLDGNPCLSADGLSLIFTSRRLGSDAADLWVSTRTSNETPWPEPSNLGPPINTPATEGGPHLSDDGLTLCFHSRRAGGQGAADLWISTRTSNDDPWSQPQNFGPLVNSPGEEFNPHLSADFLTLTFSSDRDGGYGLNDIWTSARVSMSEPWSVPVNLGPAINTTAREAGPHVSADERTLVFSSDRAGGHGEKDLWMSSRASKRDPWIAPVNLGAMVNTPRADSSAWLSADSELLYFQRSGAARRKDLWMARRLSPSEILTSSEWEWTKPVNLGPVINSQSHDADPDLSADGLALVFESLRTTGKRGIWSSTRSSLGDPWTEPVMLIAEAGAPCLSSDGRNLFFHSLRPRGNGARDVWMSTRRSADEPWSEPVNLGTTVNSEASDTHPGLSGDGLTLFFNSNRPGGQGRADLWRSIRQSIDDPWPEPANLGPTFNSLQHDSAPSISVDRLTLIFQSNRDEGAGGADLWISSSPSTAGPWPEPQNLGPPVNSAFAERAPTLSSDGRTLIFESDRPGGMGESDLWITRRVRRAR